MKFSNWKLTDLIDYLISCKSSNLLDYRCVIRASGEIILFNGESKKGYDTDEDTFL